MAGQVAPHLLPTTRCTERREFAGFGVRVLSPESGPHVASGDEALRIEVSIVTNPTHLLRNALFGAITLAVTVAAAPPAWLDDPDNSKWILFGGETGIAEQHGLDLRPGTDEGRLKPVRIEGVACGQSRRENGKPGMFYVRTSDAWDAFSTWLGQDHEVLLTLRVFDSAKGQVFVKYDSADPRVKHPPYPDGVWKLPPTYPNGVPLEGTRAWRTVSVRLPMALFTKRCHDADIRVNASAPGFALAGVAVTRVLRSEIEALLVRQRLRIARAQGMEPVGGGARFAGSFVQRQDEPIVMEAELATELSFAEGQAPGVDAAASGGAYIHHVAAARWTFTVTTPGTYAVWERAAFPGPGFWNHSEELDDHGARFCPDSHGAHPAWKWGRTGVHELEPGEHALKLSYHGGARLDVIVLTRDTETEPTVAQLPSSYVGPVSGELWTVPVSPFDVAAWRDLTFDLAAGDAEIVAEASLDGGRRWLPFDMAAGIREFPVQGNGSDSIAFHIACQGKTGGRPPLFGGAVLTYQAGPNNHRTLENTVVKLDIGPYGVKRIFDKTRGVTVLEAPSVHPALVHLGTKRPGVAPLTAVDLYSGVVQGVDIDLAAPESPHAVIRHELDNGMRTRSAVTLLPSGEMEWRLTVENRTDTEVAELQFPVLSGCRIGAAAEDDFMFLPKCWGQVWQHPAKCGAIRSHWGPAMRWTAVWDRTAGLYLGIEDQRLDDYGFRYGADMSGGVLLAPCQRILMRPKSTWESGIYRVAVTGGDWHEAADIYRKRVVATLKHSDVHPHTKWLLDAWYAQESNHMPTQGWATIQTTFDRMQQRGIYFMPANRQMTDGADSGYCGLYPYPCPAWGPLEEFQQQLAALRARGGMYTPYHNFHLWSPGYGHHRRIGSFPKSRLPDDVPKPDDSWYARAATHGYGGAYARFEQDYFMQVGMAMGAREWRDWLAYWTERYTAWGADGMYYDQFNMIYPNGRLHPDYDTYGCWVSATLDVARRIRRAARAANPFYTPSAEVCNDVYGQWMDLHMTSGVFNRLDFYTYCNPSQILIDGSWNGGLRDPFGGYERERFIWQVGARFEHMLGPDGSLDDWTGRVLDLRRAVKSILYDAAFRDTVGLVVRDAGGKVLAPEYTLSGDLWQNAPCRGVIGRWFLLSNPDERGAVVNLINHPVTKGATVTLDAAELGPVTYAMVWTLDGKRQPISVHSADDGTVTFPVPDTELSSVVLSNRLRPVVHWELDSVTTRAVTKQLKLKVTNPNAEPMRGTARLLLPDGWAIPRPVRFGPLSPGDTLTFALPVMVPKRCPVGRYDVRCELRTGHGTFTTYSFAVVNDPVLTEFRGNPRSYHLWFRNLTEETAHASVTIAVAPPLAAHAPSSVDIPPNAQLSLPITVRNRDALGQIAEMRAALKIGRRALTLVRAVMPSVPNGDFELDSAGDMKPDWWMCRKLRDRWSYERLHLDAAAHSGRYALRLDPPQEGEEFICAYPVNGVFQPGGRYRLSAWIRSENPSGVYVSAPGVRLGAGKTTAEWQQFTAEFTAPEHLTGLYRALYNRGPGPAWFDDLDVRLCAD